MTFANSIEHNKSFTIYCLLCTKRLDKLPYFSYFLYRIKPKLHMIIPNWNIFKPYLCYNIMSLLRCIRLLYSAILPEQLQYPHYPLDYQHSS